MLPWWTCMLPCSLHYLQQPPWVTSTHIAGTVSVFLGVLVRPLILLGSKMWMLGLSLQCARLDGWTVSMLTMLTMLS